MYTYIFLIQSQHEMFLMRKNQLDFKTLALALAVDKDKREDYIMVSLLHTLSYHSQYLFCTARPILLHIRSKWYYFFLNKLI